VSAGGPVRAIAVDPRGRLPEPPGVQQMLPSGPRS
jgi:hypothetical protein